MSLCVGDKPKFFDRITAKRYLGYISNYKQIKKYIHHQTF